MYQKQLLSSLAAIGLLAQGSLCSWSRASDDSDISLKTDFPFAQDQQWAVEESYLLWKPYMQNMWYGSKETFRDAGSTRKDSLKVKNPEFEWSSGVRMGLTRYFSHHDSWDLNLTGTYLYSDTHDTTHANPRDNIFFNELLLQKILTRANKGEFTWRLNYWTLDLCLGRLFKMTPQIVFHPYFGLRGSWQYQSSHLKAEQLLGLTTTVVKGKIDNDFWGLGPRFGTHFIYYFQNHFSFLANFAASLLAGSQKIRNRTNTSTTAPGFFNETQLRAPDSLRVIRTNLEGMIGLGWERWMKNHTVRVAPSIAFEGSLWFAMNQLWELLPTINNTGSRRHGNLGLMGVTFDLQVDF